MKRYSFAVILICFLFMKELVLAQQDVIDGFSFKENSIKLERLAQPNTPFDKVGRRFAMLGFEDGSFEAWAYPIKLFRNFEFSFLLKESTRPIRARDIVRFIEVKPEVTTITFTYQSFTMKAHYIAHMDLGGGVILLDLDSTEPVSIVCSFIPVLQPMWPAGIGGQYSYWDDNLRAYIISEPTGKNHGIVGSECARGISYTPAHMLSDQPSEFEIEVAEPEKLKGKFIPIVVAGGKGKWKEIVDLYKNIQRDPQELYRKAVNHFLDLRKSTLQIRTPDRKIDHALEWAKVAYDNLIVDNPDLGKGMVAGLGPSGTGGRPGFGWFFGGDTYINSLSINSYCGYKTVRNAIEFMIKFQRKDGKMAHEVSQAAGYIDWFGDYHYGYIHGDTSPYFIVAMADYITMSGDIEFLKKHWDSVKRAYEWSLATDGNGDGLMDNRKAGLGALEYGKLIGGITTDIYIGAVWVRAVQAMEKLSRIVGERDYSERVKDVRIKAERAFKEKFWDDELEFYSYAFNQNGQHVKEFSPWNAVGMMWGLGDSEKSKKSLEKICSSELATDWGVRSISNKSKYYQPLNYNYGAVWPFLNSWVATALFKHNFSIQGYSTLMSTIQGVFDNQLGAVGEVFSGELYTWPQEAVPHQGFSTAGTVLPLVRGLLGLQGDAINREVRFAPQFPADWDEVLIRNYRIGNSVFSFVVHRKHTLFVIDILIERADGFNLKLMPVFGTGTVINSIKINNRPVKFRLIESDQIVQPEVDIPIERLNKLHVEYAISPVPELIPPFCKPRIGDGNSGLKIISFYKKGKRLHLTCEGVGGRSYKIGFTNPEMIRSVHGAEKIMDGISVIFPSGQPGEFKKKSIIIEL